MSPDVPSANATIRSSAYRARAWWGDDLLADSTRALRVDVAGEPPTLWFPWEDVRPGRLRSVAVELWEGGQIERFDADGPVPEQREEVTWADEPGAAGDGTRLVRRLSMPPPGMEILRDHATVDHAQARVELVDTVDGDDPRDVTVKRFPVWGDAADLIAVLDAGVVVHDEHRPVVEGSQLLGQTIVAAMRRAPDRRRVTAHMVFLP